MKKNKKNNALFLPDCCPLCKTIVTRQTSEHLLLRCQEASQLLNKIGVTYQTLLDFFTTPSKQTIVSVGLTCFVLHKQIMKLHFEKTLIHATYLKKAISDEKARHKAAFP